MKLGKKSWLFIAIGFFLIALASLWTVYSQQSGVKKQLKEELTLANSRLGSIQIEQFANNQSELEQQLDEIIKQSEAARGTLSQPMNSIIISDILFSTAEANSVNITEVSSSGMTNEELSGVPCLALPLTASVEGDLSNLVAFITQLNGDLATGFISSIDMSITDPASNQKPSVNIQMVIYTRKES